MLYDSDLNDAWLLRACFPHYTKPDACRWAEAAAFFGVKQSTVKTWYRQNELPFMARKLCLIKRGGCLSLHGKQWRDFCVVDNVLHTPIKGYSLTANQVAATWYLVANMRDKPRAWFSACGYDRR